MQRMKVKDIMLLYESLKDPLRAGQRLNRQIRPEDRAVEALQAPGFYFLGAWIVDIKRNYSLADPQMADKTLEELNDVTHSANALRDLSVEIHQRLSLEYNSGIKGLFVRQFDEIRQAYQPAIRSLIPRWEATANELLPLVNGNPFGDLLQQEAVRLKDGFNHAARDITGSYGRDLAQRAETGILRGVEQFNRHIDSFRQIENAITTIAQSDIQELIPKLADLKKLDLTQHRNVMHTLVSASNLAGTVVGFLDSRAGNFITQAVPEAISAFQTANKFLTGKSFLDGAVGFASTLNFAGAAVGLVSALSRVNQGRADNKVLKSLAGIQRSIDGLNRKVDVIDKKLDVIDKKLDSIAIQLGNIDLKLNEVIEQLTGINRNIGVLGQKLDQQRKILVNITKFLVDVDRENRSRHDEVIAQLGRISEDLTILMQFAQNTLFSELNLLRADGEGFAAREKMMSVYTTNDIVMSKFLDATAKYHELIISRSFDQVLRTTGQSSIRTFEDLGDSRDLDSLVEAQNIVGNQHLISGAVRWLKAHAIHSVYGKGSRLPSEKFGSFWASNENVRYPHPLFWLNATSGYFELKRIVPEFDYNADSRSSTLESFINEFHDRDAMILVDNNGFGLAADIYRLTLDKVLQSIIARVRSHLNNEFPNAKDWPHWDLVMRFNFGLATSKEIFELLKGSFDPAEFEQRVGIRPKVFFDSIEITRRSLDLDDRSNINFKTELAPFLQRLDNALNTAKIMALVSRGQTLDATLRRSDRSSGIDFMSDNETTLKKVLLNLPGSREVKDAMTSAGRTSHESLTSFTVKDFFDPLKIASIPHEDRPDRQVLRSALLKARRRPEIIRYIYSFNGRENGRIYSPYLSQYTDDNRQLVEGRQQGIREFDQSGRIAGLANLAL